MCVCSGHYIRLGDIKNVGATAYMYVLCTCRVVLPLPSSSLDLSLTLSLPSSLSLQRHITCMCTHLYMYMYTMHFKVTGDRKYNAIEIFTTKKHSCVCLPNSARVKQTN